MALDVTGLSDFNNEVAGELLVKSVYAGSTMEYITVREGVKHSEPINLLDVELALQYGTCTSTPSGSATFSQRNIVVCPRTSFDGICLKDMDKKYLGIAELEPGSYNESFAAASAYAELISNKMQKSNDQFIWQGDAGCTDGGSGLIATISGSTAGVVTTGSAAATLDNLDVMMAAQDSDYADRDDNTFFMSITKFKQFVSDLRKENNYNFDPAAVENRGGILEMEYPFAPGVKVIGTVGLQGSDRIVYGPAKLIVAGTDLMSDWSEFQVWYDINTDQLRHRLASKLGVQIAVPEAFVSNDLA